MGKSVGDITRAAAHAEAQDQSLLIGRDVDMAFSPPRAKAGRCVGRRVARLPVDQRCNIVLVSTHVRAVNTAALIRSADGLAASEHSVCVEERLREKKLGALGGPTHSGVAKVRPDQVHFTRSLGKSIPARPPASAC
jgi:broad specificity phosphatase PhoE